MLNGRLRSTALAAALLGATAVTAAPENYVIDTRGGHAFVQFRISHLGVSWLYGRFDDFEGGFSFDPEAPADSSVQVEIRTASINSGLERRDDHLRGEDFLKVEAHPVATFTSTAFEPLGEDRYRLTGDLSLLGQTRSVSIDVEQTGAGEDPWGSYRRGFEGTTTLDLTEWGITYPVVVDYDDTLDMTLSIEGIRQDAE